MKRALDVISIGRSSVDLYGGQVGGRLEDMRSFRKYIGGSPTNAAAGAARLGLRSAVITRVGDEHMGRFIREQLRAEGVDVRGVITDPHRLTALVLLGIRDQERFPLIFYRENCADMALSPDDIDPDFIAEARCVLASGTHLSHPRTEAATLRALDLARDSGARTILDLDYRPNLWGLSGHGDGENRFIKSAAVTAKLQSTLARFDVIVGTEEEFHIAGGASGTVEALANVRNVSEATLVCKRGAAGATAFEGPVPASLDEGVNGESFRVEVFNVLGAGDGFMAGLLKGWLTGEDWAETLRIANACGALAVSRHGCTPAYPSAVELRDFLANGPATPAVRHDTRLEQIHWATNRSRAWPSLRVFAFDHRAQFEEMARDCSAVPDRGAAERIVRDGRDGLEDTAVTARIGAFKRLCLEAALRVADGRDGYGVLCDGRLGRDALYAAAGTGLWIGASGGEARQPAATAGDQRRFRLGTGGMASRARGEGALLLPPGRPGGASRRPGGDGQAAGRGCTRQRPGLPGGDHPVEVRLGGTIPPRPRSSSGSTRSGSIPTGGSWSRWCRKRPGREPAPPSRTTIPIAGASWCWAWTHPSRSCGRASRRRLGIRW